MDNDAHPAEAFPSLGTGNSASFRLDLRSAAEALATLKTSEIYADGLSLTRHVTAWKGMPPPFAPAEGAEAKGAVELFFRDAGAQPGGALLSLDDRIPPRDWTPKGSFLLLPWPWKPFSVIAGIESVPLNESGSARNLRAAFIKVEDLQTSDIPLSEVENTGELPPGPVLPYARIHHGLLKWMQLALRYARLRHETLVGLPSEVLPEYFRIREKDIVHFENITGARPATEEEQDLLGAALALCPYSYPDKFPDVGWKQVVERFREVTGRAIEIDTLRKRVNAALKDENRKS